MPLTVVETHSRRRPSLTFFWELPHGRAVHVVSTRHIETKESTYYHAYLNCGCIVRAQFRKELDDLA